MIYHEIDGVQRYVGTFRTEQEARDAYRAAVDEVARERAAPAQQWIRYYAADPPETDDCITWPFSTDQAGYARVTNPRTKRHDGAFRVIWETVYDRPWPKGKQARHTCGKGHEGCINHKHIIPGTRAENAADKVGHGTVPRGTDHAGAKLDDTKVTVICELLASEQYRQQDVAAFFGVSPTTVSKIWLGHAWSHVDAPRRKAS